MKIFFTMIYLILACSLCWAEKLATKMPKSTKLYWFIPDGMRVDPDLFTLYKWAEEGKLPNIKRLMDEGSYGYSIPVFPSHTPVNFATLLTGTLPKTHGVGDGAMRVEGQALAKPSVAGFSSTAKLVPPIWKVLEENGKKVTLLSMPGSTPPEISKGNIFRGRWGGWGADPHSIIFESNVGSESKKVRGKASRLFYMGPKLTEQLTMSPAMGWQDEDITTAKYGLETVAEAWGLKIFFRISDSEMKGAGAYDRLSFSLDKKKIFTVKQGEWSDWLPVELNWSGLPYASHIKVKNILQSKDGFFRARVLYGNLNQYNTQPSALAKSLVDAAGPMVDFVDNYPPQLVYYKQDKETYLEEQDLSFAWHRRASKYIFEKLKPDIFIHDIYNPNQMLTSKWWMGYLDPASIRYKDITEEERKDLWKEVYQMYTHLDEIIGEALKHKDKNSYVVLSSDHGALPMNYSVKLNNLFAKKGWLKFSKSPGGELGIDWKSSQVVFLAMQNVYINPRGLGGPWTRASGPEFEALKAKVKEALSELRDSKGLSVTNHVFSYEEASSYLGLPADRGGDLIVVNNPGYGWTEELSEDLEIFSSPIMTGYKQAVDPKANRGLWTPFVIMGPGIKKNFKMTKPISHIDQYPTIMKAMGQTIPEYVEGKPVREIFSR